MMLVLWSDGLHHRAYFLGILIQAFQLVFLFSRQAHEFVCGVESMTTMTAGFMLGQHSDGCELVCHGICGLQRGKCVFMFVLYYGLASGVRDEDTRIYSIGEQN